MSASSVDLDEARKAMARAVIRLDLGQTADGRREVGTAFMVHPRLALTAYHNLPDALRSGEQKRLQGSHGGEVLTFELITEAAVEQHDLAALRLTENPGRVSLGWLKAAWLPPDVSVQEASVFWHARRIAIYGFPVHGAGQADRWIVGTLHTGQPLEEIDLGEAFDKEPTGLTRRFRCVADNTADLPGISGAPMYDLEKRRVIGVETSYHEPSEGVANVYGTPLCRLVDAWPEFAAECRGLELRTTEPTRKLAIGIALTVLFVLILIAGGYFLRPSQKDVTPTATQTRPVAIPIEIEVTFPVFHEGQETALISGRVKGVDFATHRIVVFARTDLWYVQPDVANYKVTIESDGRWTTETRGGDRFAVLLVRSTFTLGVGEKKREALPSGEDIVSTRILDGRQ